jgi:hypothetical protein
LPNQLEIPKLQAPRKNIKSMEHKEIQLVDNDPEKMALIGKCISMVRSTSTGYLTFCHSYE